MKRIDVKELEDNFFDTIGKEWMLVTAGTPDHFNLMTASWGGIGWLWNMPVAFVFIRPERHTFAFAEQSDHISLSFLGMSREARDIYKICGSKSGRDTDKVALCGLTVASVENDCVAYRESRLTLVGRKLYADFLKPECFADAGIPDKWYTTDEAARKRGDTTNGLHKMYIVELTGAFVRE